MAFQHKARTFRFLFTPFFILPLLGTVPFATPCRAEESLEESWTLQSGERFTGTFQKRERSGFVFLLPDGSEKQISPGDLDGESMKAATKAMMRQMRAAHEKKVGETSRHGSGRSRESNESISSSPRKSGSGKNSTVDRDIFDDGTESRTWTLANGKSFVGKLVDYEGLTLSFQLSGGEVRELRYFDLCRGDQEKISTLKMRKMEKDRKVIEQQAKEELKRRQAENVKENPVPFRAAGDNGKKTAVPDDEFGSVATPNHRSFLHFRSTSTDYSDCTARKVGEATVKWNLPVRPVPVSEINYKVKAVTLDRGAADKKVTSKVMPSGGRIEIEMAMRRIISSSRDRSRSSFHVPRTLLLGPQDSGLVVHRHDIDRRTVLNVYQAKTGRPLSVEFDHLVEAHDVSPDGHLLAVSYSGETFPEDVRDFLLVLDLRNLSLRPIRKFRPFLNSPRTVSKETPVGITRIDWIDDGRLLVTSDDSRCILFDRTSGKVAYEISFAPYAGPYVTPDRQTVVFAQPDRLGAFDAVSGKQVAFLSENGLERANAQARPFDRHLVFSPDGTRFVSYRDHWIVLRETASGKLIDAVYAPEHRTGFSAGALLWLDNRFVFVSGMLFDSEKHFVCWKYEAEEGAVIQSLRSWNGVQWFVLKKGHADQTETWTLVPTQMLDDIIVTKNAAAATDREFRFDKRTPVAIEFAAEFREEDREKLTDRFRAQLEDYGMRFAKDSVHRIRLSTIPDAEPTEITYYHSPYSRNTGPFVFGPIHGRGVPLIALRRMIPGEGKEAGKVRVRLYTYRIEILSDEKVFWEASQTVEIPNNFTKDSSDNETLEETVLRRLKPNAKWYMTVSLPNVFEYPIRGQVFGKTVLGEEKIVSEF